MTLDGETFKTRYMITSTTGRIYGRKALLDYGTRSNKTLLTALGLTRRDLAEVLDDDSFTRRHAGSIPQRVCDEAISEAYHRKVQRER